MTKLVSNFEFGNETLAIQEYYEKVINVLENGVVLDGTDQTTNIQNVIDNNPNSVIYFPDGTYEISNTLKTSANSSKRVVLALSKYAVLKANNNFPAESYMVDIGGSDTFDANNGIPLGITGGVINTNFRANGIKIEKSHMAFITNIVLTNVSFIGIDIEQSNNLSADAQIRNVIVYGQQSLSTNIGMVLNSADNNINTFRTMHTGKGIILNQGGNILNDCHVLCSADTMTNYNDTIGYEINSVDNQFDNIYADNYSIGLYFKPAVAYYNVIGKYFSLWYSATANKTHAFVSGMFNNNIIESINGSIPSLGDNYIWHYTDTDAGRDSMFFNQMRGIIVDELKVNNGTFSYLKYPLFDYGFLTRSSKATYFNGGTLSPNTWIPVGAFLIPTTNTLVSKIEVSLGWDTYADIYFKRGGIMKADLKYAGATGRKIDVAMSYYPSGGEGNMFKIIIWIKPNFETEQRISTTLLSGWAKQMILPQFVNDYVTLFNPTTTTPAPLVGNVVSSNKKNVQFSTS